MLIMHMNSQLYFTADRINPIWLISNSHLILIQLSFKHKITLRTSDLISSLKWLQDQVYSYQSNTDLHISMLQWGV